MAESIDLTPYEEEGVFLEVRFRREEDRSVVFVAKRDLEGLVRLARNPDKSLEDLEQEFLFLVEHSGIREEKSLGRETLEALEERLRSLELGFLELGDEDG